MYCLIIGLALIYICNVVNIIMIVLYLQKDDKFSITYKKTKSTNIFIRIIAGIFYLKFH